MTKAAAGLSSLSVFHGSRKTKTFVASGLEISVISALHLPKMDVFGTCDAYCEVKWLGLEYRTRIVKNSYNAEFDDVFEFELAEGERASENLYIVVKDWDRMNKDEVVGHVVVSAAILNKLLGSHTMFDGPLPVKKTVFENSENVQGFDGKKCVLHLKISGFYPQTTRETSYTHTHSTHTHTQSHTYTP
jgi:Ca2+-dependent lipid-binding protein